MVTNAGRDLQPRHALDLHFLDTDKYAVAFLAQTLILKDQAVHLQARWQALKVSPKTKLIAVTRIETKNNVA